jgi:GNAT superfamily N-acetyltransferase
MDSPALEVYVESFLARCAATQPPGQATLVEPGIYGLLPPDHGGRLRLLVTDDRARERLSTTVADVRAGMITVCAAAAQCSAMLATDPAWRAGTATAMICRDLRTVPAPGLPTGLTLRPVRRRREDPAEGVPLTQAVNAACRADPENTDPRALADHLRSLPRAFGLWVAVDDHATVRGTAGSAAFGATGSVIFVNTDPDWRRRGIARAMTAIALRTARQAGARHAGLDASNAGKELYLKLGFEPATPVTRFRRST